MCSNCSQRLLFNYHKQRGSVYPHDAFHSHPLASPLENIDPQPNLLPRGGKDRSAATATSGARLPQHYDRLRWVVAGAIHRLPLGDAADEIRIALVVDERPALLVRVKKSRVGGAPLSLILTTVAMSEATGAARESAFLDARKFGGW